MLKPKKCLVGKLNQVIQKVYPQLQSKTATPSEEVQIVEPDRGVYGLKKVTINEIPGEYVIPTGSVDITSNGNHDVSGKETANVNVQPDLETKSVTITENGTTTINKSQNKDGMTSVEVSVQVPQPTGTISITQNGVVDVTNYASANVSVSGGERLEDYFTTTIDSNTELNDNYVTRGMLKKPYRISCTNEITDLGNAFTNYPLEYIDVSGLDVSNVISANNMFSQCSSLKEIVFGNLQFSSNIGAVAGMFKSSPNLTKLDLSNVFVSTNKVYTFNGMFYGTQKLAILDISSFVFNAGVIISNSEMFYNCGAQCLQSDGAYADGIPYIFVKDTAAQNYILSLAGTRRPASWTSANVVVAGGPDDPRV